MEDRDFDEIALRNMLHNATGYEPDIVEGRYAIRTKHGGRPWEVIVEPDEDHELLVVVTAYPTETS